MNTDEKILKAIEDLKQDQKKQFEAVNTRLDQHGKQLDNAATKDDVERIENRQVVIEQEIYEVQKDQKAIKGMIQLLNSNVVKTGKAHEKRIENLEERTGAENPLKH